MQVTVIGTGYVGLVTGAALADIGHRVTCLDSDREKIARLQVGRIPIYEPGLEALVRAAVQAGNLAFTSSLEEAVTVGAEVYFIAVGTPCDPIDGGANLEQVFHAADGLAAAIAQHAPAGPSPAVFVTKSTVPVGTNRTIEKIVGRHLPADRFAIASNPEFLREGAAIGDFMNPDRIVIGSNCEKARRTLENLYRPLTRNGVPMLVVSSVETAELIKYAANAFLATKITFINEIARLSDAVGASIDEIVSGVGLDHRIGQEFLSPGPGYGGSCFPKDTQALVKTAIEHDSPLGVVEAVIAANQRHKLMMIAKIREAVGGSLAGKRIAVLGLAFKANTDDMRDSPALVIVPGLMRQGAQVTAYDPVAGPNARLLMKNVDIRDRLHEAVSGADAVVILTEWPEFRSLDLAALTETCNARVVVDLRNVVSPERVTSFDGHYVGLGRVSPNGAPVQGASLERVA